MMTGILLLYVLLGFNSVLPSDVLGLTIDWLVLLNKTFCLAYAALDLWQRFIWLKCFAKET